MGNSQSSKEVVHRKEEEGSAAGIARAQAGEVQSPPTPQVATPEVEQRKSPDEAAAAAAAAEEAASPAQLSQTEAGAGEVCEQPSLLQEPARKQEGEEKASPAPPQQSLVLNRLLELYTHSKEWTAAADTKSIRINVESLGEDTQNGVRSLAALMGFPSVQLDAGVLVLERPEGSEEDRAAAAWARLGPRDASLPAFLVGLDEVVQKYVDSYLSDIVDDFAASGNPKHTVEARFLLPSAQAQELLHKLAKAKKLGASGWSLLGPGIEIPLNSSTMSGAVDGADAMADSKASPRVIPEGELVWRRLQHWCTNVRKEKKFNIWARNLDAGIKQKIIDVALEVGSLIDKDRQSYLVQPRPKPHTWNEFVVSIFFAAGWI